MELLPAEINAHKLSAADKASAGEVKPLGVDNIMKLQEKEEVLKKNSISFNRIVSFVFTNLVDKKINNKIIKVASEVHALLEQNDADVLSYIV